MTYDSDDLFESKNRPPTKKSKSKAKRRVMPVVPVGVKPVAPVQLLLIGITTWVCQVCTYENEEKGLSRTRQKCAMCYSDRIMPAATKRQTTIPHDFFVPTNREDTKMSPAKKNETLSKKRTMKDASIDVDDQLDTKKPPAKKKRKYWGRCAPSNIKFFNDKILKLKEFKQFYGHLKVVPSYDEPLYLWCRKIRNKKVKLLDWQIASLDDIDFFVQKKPTGKLDMYILYQNQSNKI